MAHLKGYESKETYERFRESYKECIRMLNGIERTLARYLPERDRRWPERKGEEGPELRVQEESAEYRGDAPPGYPEP